MIPYGNVVCRLLRKPAVQAVREVFSDPPVFVPVLEDLTPADSSKSCLMMCGHCDEYSVKLNSEGYPRIYKILETLGVLGDFYTLPQTGLTFDAVLHHLGSYIATHVSDDGTSIVDPL